LLDGCISPPYLRPVRNSIAAGWNRDEFHANSITY